MGEKPIEYGICPNCSHCWGPGKEFGDVPTPCLVTISGSGFPPEADEANGSWILRQEELNRCKWTGQSNGLIGYLEYTAANSLCQIDQGAVTIFASAEPPCVKEFDDGAKHVSIS